MRGCNDDLSVYLQDEPLRADYYSAYAAYGAEGMSTLRNNYFSSSIQNL